MSTQAGVKRELNQLEKSRDALTSRMNQIEDRTLGPEDQVEEPDHTSREYETYMAEWGMQEIWNTVRKLSLQIIGMDEVEEFQVNGINQTFSRITKHFLREDKAEQMQGVPRTSTTRDQKKSPGHIIVKTLCRQQHIENG